jgi:hypothetical protein
LGGNSQKLLFFYFRIYSCYSGGFHTNCFQKREQNNIIKDITISPLVAIDGPNHLYSPSSFSQGDCGPGTLQQSLIVPLRAKCKLKDKKVNSKKSKAIPVTGREGP